MEDFFENYYSPFVTYKYHGLSERSDCTERCTALLGGLLPFSRLESLANLVRNESRWIDLCFNDPNNRAHTFESCKFFADAEFDWQARVWRSQGIKLDENVWSGCERLSYLYFSF